MPLHIIHPLTTTEIAIYSALCAVVFAVVLAGEDSPLNFFFRWAEEWRDAGGWRSWIASPIGGCEKCMAGQVALWSSILIRGGHSVADLLTHFGTASLAVLLAAAIAHAYRWLKRKI
jgi:hypothetical protein